jgi:hypothetical protein
MIDKISTLWSGCRCVIFCRRGRGEKCVSLGFTTPSLDQTGFLATLWNLIGNSA